MPNTTRFYELLGVPKDASQADIRKAYKLGAMKYHPDRNKEPGAEDKFKEINMAYEVLNDESKRRLYDQYGEEGLERGGFEPSQAGSIFEQFFGGGFGRREAPTRTEDVKHAIPVTLEDLYNGKVRKLKLTRKVLCATCRGSGGKEGKSASKCNKCDGHGVRIVRRQVGPGMMQQMQVACDDCDGEGEVLAAADRCTTCKGKHTVEEKEILEVPVDKGMQHGQTITLPGKADEAPGLRPGDVVFVLQQKEHEVFQRKGDDLFMKKTITLTEALTGFQFIIKHLDGRELIVKSQDGEIVRPGQIKGIADEGMPQHRNPFLKGHLFVAFEIKFPESLSDAQLSTLRTALPAAPREQPTGTDTQEVFLSEELTETKRRGAGEAYEDDPRGGRGGGGGGVQCAQQ